MSLVLAGPSKTASGLRPSATRLAKQRFLNALEEDMMLHQPVIYPLRNRKQTETEMAVAPGLALACPANIENTHHRYTNFVKSCPAADATRAVLFVLLLAGALLAPPALHSQIQAPGGPSGSGRAAATVPQISFTGAQGTVGNALNQPASVVVDGAGNTYVADTGNNRVLKVSQGGAQTTVGSGLNQPSGVTVDAAGDVFIADTGNGRIVEVSAGGAQTTVASGYSSPVGVAVDHAGDVFIADSANTRVAEISANPQMAVALLGSGLSHPAGVVVDAAGDVFISDSGNGRVVELGPNGQTTVVSGLLGPRGIAVDGAGNVFVADGGNSRVLEVPASGPQSTVGSGLNQPAGVAVDPAGDVFIADSGNHRVLEVQRNASVNFGSANVCPSGQATLAPCSQAVTLNYTVTQGAVVGAVNVLTGGASNLDFTLTGTTCVGNLPSGFSCAVNVTFAPQAPGIRRGAVQLVNIDGQIQNVLATTLFYGEGQGPAIAFGPGTQTTVGNGLYVPVGVAVDDAGDVFIVDSHSGIVEIPAGGGAQTTVASRVVEPTSVAVDGAGDVFVMDRDNNQVWRFWPVAALCLRWEAD
jgi:sugar lactone lactonase YvrE